MSKIFSFFSSPASKSGATQIVSSKSSVRCALRTLHNPKSSPCSPAPEFPCTAAPPAKLLGLLLLLGLLVAPARQKAIAPAIAHDVEVGTDVAVTFHLEPNHNPRAGETAEVWFALTRRGGKIIPLDQCDCQLGVYSQPRASEDEPLMEPELNPISVERYSGIPGAEIVFPEAGSYELELTGAPKEGDNFEPFELSFSVVVQP